MVAGKCDRCGKLYELYYLLEDLTGSLKNYRYYRIEKQTIPDNYSKYLDLCPDCQEALKKWVELSE